MQLLYADDIKFYGWDILKYYWYIFQDRFDNYPWQVVVAYSIVVLSIISFIVLGILFTKQVHQTRKRQKHHNKIDERFHDIIETILKSDKMSTIEIMNILEEKKESDDEDLKEYAEDFLSIFVAIRSGMPQAVLPNLPELASLLGVREYCEESLLKNHNAFNALQALAMLQLVITEGRLANYVNHRDKDIRMMARLCYIISAITDPYKYMTDELESSPSMLLNMMLHYIFAWKKETGQALPDFINISNILTNKQNSGFMKKEYEFFK